MRDMNIVEKLQLGHINIYSQKKSIFIIEIFFYIFFTKCLILSFFISLKVFVLGPCHHLYMEGCGISSLDEY